MNLVNFYRSLQLKTFKRPTVEFRFPEGTLVSQSIKNWARILINFVNRMALENLNFESLQTVNLTKTLEILGLGGDKDKFYLLSPGLHDSKIWLLKRIIRYASYPHQELIVEAKKILSLLENTDVPEG
jgi:hypothetical protein